jgi:hypothetical protein
MVLLQISCLREENHSEETGGLLPHVPFQLVHPSLDYQGNTFMGCDCHIESVFKLLKSAGHHVEHWQQETAEAIATRLLVATMACVVVWQLAGSEEPEANAWRQRLVRLSGRPMKWGTAFTAPALLAGLGILLVMLEVVEQYDIEEIQRLAGIFFLGPYPLNL